MATNDNLDNFFKKKDRKGKKQTGILTNNEELHKQLVIVTSATSAFKKNMDLDDDDDEQAIHDEPIVAPVITEDTHKHSKTKIPDTNKHVIVSSSIGGQPQQDEWEEFEDSNAKYEQLRLKFSQANNGDDDEYDDHDDDHENNPNNNNNNTNDNNNDITGDRDLQKDKPVWKINQMKEQSVEPIVEKKVEEPPKPAATSSSGAYRPPQMRSGASVTIVSGPNPRVSKKKEPNLASTDDFPTLGATVQKK